MNYLPTCTSRLVVQHPCQVLFKSMQGCRRSWEDKLKCVKILSVKDHNSAKICWTWIISPHALLDMWYNICTKFHLNPCKDVGGVEKTNFDVTEWRTKQTLNAPLQFYGGGIKIQYTYVLDELFAIGDACIAKDVEAIIQANSLLVLILAPRRGFKLRIRPPYPQLVVKGD